MATQGNLCALVKRYPKEAVKHFVNLREMALTCARIPDGGVDCATRERLRAGKSHRIYDPEEVCDGPINKKQRLLCDERDAKTLSVNNVGIEHSLLDDRHCPLCQQSELHTTVSLEYCIKDEGNGTWSDDHYVYQPCLPCARALIKRDPTWQQEWQEVRATNYDEKQRLHAYQTYLQYGLVDPLYRYRLKARADFTTVTG